MKLYRMGIIFSYVALTFVLNSNVKANTEMSYAEASSYAKSLALSSQSEHGLGCSKAKVVKVDETYSSNNKKLIRAVLYADCISCQHVYMFEKQSKELVFSESVVVTDPVWYQKTCVADKQRALR